MEASSQFPRNLKGNVTMMAGWVFQRGRVHCHPKESSLGSIAVCQLWASWPCSWSAHHPREAGADDLLVRQGTIYTLKRSNFGGLSQPWDLGL